MWLWKGLHRRQGYGGIARKIGEGGRLGVVMQDQQRHPKYRARKAKAAWGIARHLTRLPLREKRKIVKQQILPILTYGCDLYPEPSEEQRSLTDGRTGRPDGDEGGEMGGVSLQKIHPTTEGDSGTDPMGDSG